MLMAFLVVYLYKLRDKRFMCRSTDVEHRDMTYWQILINRKFQLSKEACCASSRYAHILYFITSHPHVIISVKMRFHTGHALVLISVIFAGAYHLYSMRI